MIRARSTQEGKCPYCEYAWTVDVSSVLGENRALRCLSCKELFVVEITVHISAAVHKLAGIDPNEVLDRLSPLSPKHPARHAQRPPPRPAGTTDKGRAKVPLSLNGRTREVRGTYGGGE